MSKISIRIFNDKEVRAVWDETKNRWRFSAADVVMVLGGHDDYEKARNYWKWLKAKLKKEKNELGSSATQLKFMASDGKKYKQDVFDAEGIKKLAKQFPGKRANRFIEWFIYSDETIDGQSKQKAYALWASSFIENIETGTVKGLIQIHSYLFGGLYDFAGKIRQVNISKDGFKFAAAQFLDETLMKIELMPEKTFKQIISKYIDMNIAHPFMEGNGRAMRIWLDMMLKKNLKKCVDWSKISKRDYFRSMKESVVGGDMIYKQIRRALTDKIDDREMFMKGIDYSYYYEEPDIVVE